MRVAMGDPETTEARAEVRRLLEHAIYELPISFRLVLIMREIDKMPLEESAAQLEIRPETVKTRLRRARKLLRQQVYEKLTSALKDAFPFRGACCARMSVAARFARGPWHGRFTLVDEEQSSRRPARPSCLAGNALAGFLSH